MNALVSTWSRGQEDNQDLLQLPAPHLSDHGTHLVALHLREGRLQLTGVGFLLFSVPAHTVYFGQSEASNELDYSVKSGNCQTPTITDKHIFLISGAVM